MEEDFNCDVVRSRGKAGDLYQLSYPFAGYQAAKVLDVVAQVQFALQDAVPGILEGHREAAIVMVHRWLQSL